MQVTLFCFIILIFNIGNHYINGLDCYSCLNVGQNTTHCHDPFNTNGTSIKVDSVTTSDSLCVKIVGKLSDNNKFTLRKGNENGCPRGLNSSDIVGNTSTIRVADLKINCCNKHLCNHGINRKNIQWNISFLIAFMYFFSLMSI
ncbi:unnamed protein product [Adineta steineri]|uniref:Uncharacterized protein n=1 Tax=Adineta steineri TaxID=433720 RepID=A0A819BAC0_9BILA|nr:unnamed protein product [Adineta steineri]